MVLPQYKKLLLIGIVMIIVGSGLLVFVLPKYLSRNYAVETVNQYSIDLTTKSSYFSDKFRAEAGYWLDLDIVSDGPSVLHISGQVAKEIYKVEGTRYQYKVTISQGDVYQVQVENKKGHYEWIIIWTPDDNHITGGIYLRRNVLIVDTLSGYLLIPAFILLIAGILIIIVSISILQQQKRKAERSRTCPHCRQTVEKDRTLCPYCGFDVGRSVRCKHCDTIYDSSMYKCPNCGAKNR